MLKTKNYWAFLMILEIPYLRLFNENVEQRFR